MRHVAVVFPGRGYTHDLPGLRLPAQVLEAAGAAVVSVSYPGGADDFSNLLVAGRWEEVAKVGQVLREAVEGADRVTLIGKSMGTAVMAHLEPGVRVEDAIWITPIFSEEEVCAGAIATGWRSLCVYGTADPVHDPVAQSAVTERLQGQELPLAGMNHAMEVTGDPRATALGYLRLVEGIASFIAG